MAMPPPAPVPTTIASKSLMGMCRSPLSQDSQCCSAMIGGLREMRMFGIVGMRAAWHFGPGGAQAGIAERFQSDLGGVVADDGVIAHHLKEFAPGFGGGVEVRLIREHCEETLLLVRAAVQKLLAKFRGALCVDPI